MCRQLQWSMLLLLLRVLWLCASVIEYVAPTPVDPVAGCVLSASVVDVVTPSEGVLQGASVDEDVVPAPVNSVVGYMPPALMVRSPPVFEFASSSPVDLVVASEQPAPVVEYRASPVSSGSAFARPCPYADFRAIPGSFDEYITRTKGKVRFVGAAISFDEYVREASQRLLRTRSQVYHIADSLKLLRPPWNTPLQPAPEGFEWVRIMPWEQYEMERRKEDEEKEEKKKLVWEAYLQKLCAKKLEERMEKGLEREKMEEKGEKWNVSLDHRFQALFLKESQADIVEENGKEQLVMEEKDRGQLSMNEKEKEKEVGSDLWEEWENRRCAKAAAATCRDEFRRAHGPPLTADEWARRLVRAKELSRKVATLLFPPKLGEEVCFEGQVLEQVSGGRANPEPKTIQILHGTKAGLGVFRVGHGVTLAACYGTLVGVGHHRGWDGFFSTKWGRKLDSNLPVEELGTGELTEVMFHKRLRGGGFGGNGRNTGGEGFFFAGDWQCSNCGRQGCWPTRYTCYRCGAPRAQDGGGNSPQGGQGGFAKEGLQQGGGCQWDGRGQGGWA